MAVKLAKAEAAQRLEKQRHKERVLQIDSLTEMNDEYVKPIEFVYNRPLDGEGGEGRGGRGTGRGSGGGGRGSNSPNTSTNSSNTSNTNNPNPNPHSTPNTQGRGGGGYGRGYNGYAIRNNEERKPVDTLDLDQFLAETNKSDMRAMYSGRPQIGDIYISYT